MSDPNDRDDLTRQWQANEAEINRLYGMSPLGRESYAGRIEQLEDEQDRIEYDLGNEHPPGSRKWSGTN